MIKKIFLSKKQSGMVQKWVRMEFCYTFIDLYKKNELLKLNGIKAHKSEKLIRFLLFGKIIFK